MSGEFGPWPTVCGRFRIWRDAGVFTTLLEGLIAEAARRGWTDLSLVSVDSTTVRAHHDAAGMCIGEEAHGGLGGSRCRVGAGPEKGGSLQEQNGQGDQNGPGWEGRRSVRQRHRLRLDNALLGRSRGGLTSKAISPGTADAVHCRSCSPRDRPPTVLSSSPYSRWCGSACPSAVPAPGPVRSPQTRPTHPAPTVPTCTNARSRRSSQRRGTKPPTGRRRAAGAAGPSATTPTSTRNGTPSSAGSTNSRHGGHRYSIRQDTRKLPHWPLPTRLDDLDQRPPTGTRLITTPHSP